MLSGWVEKDDDLYYCGTENEGWAYTGWQYLEPSEDRDSDIYDDQEWFNFKSSGKAATGKTIDWYSKGRYYTFDDNGVMTSDWYDLSVASPASDSIATAANAGVDKNAYTSEDGSKGTGWVYTEDPNESDSNWYYLVSVKSANGKTTYRNIPFNAQSGDDSWRAKVIKGKTYIFNAKGEMQDGLVILGTDGNGTTGEKNVYGLDADGNVVAASDNKGGAISKAMADGVYYFNEDGGSVNGQMVTGKTTVVKDGENRYYYFDKKTGRAIDNEVKDGVVYGADGQRVAADDGNSNEVVEVTNDTLYKNEYIAANSNIIVSSAGKLRTSGTVKVDGVYWDVKKVDAGRTIDGKKVYTWDVVYNTKKND